MLLDEYIQNIPNERLARFNSIRALITSHYPQAIESMKYKMPTFELNGHWLALANQKNYLSVYTCAAPHLVSFQVKYPKIKTGKGCINLKDKDTFEIDDLIPVITSALTIDLK